MKTLVLLSVGFLVFIMVITGPSMFTRATPTLTETVYRTPSGHACNEQDWTRQFMQGPEPGEEKCSVHMVTRPLTPQEKEAADRSREQKEHAHYEELKMNCVLLSHTPMSAMTPSDLEQWDFCKSIMTKY